MSNESEVCNTNADIFDAVHGSTWFPVEQRVCILTAGATVNLQFSIPSTEKGTHLRKSH